MLTQEQIQNRTKGIGASEVAALFGMHDYLTQYQLWLQKTNQYKPETTNDRLWWGSNLEPVIADRYTLLTGDTVTADPETRYSPDSKYLLCHIDREIKQKQKLVELKIASYNPSKWGEPGTSEVPPQYQLQVQAQLACNPGYTEADLVVCFYQTLDVKIYNIKRDNDLIAKINAAVTKFWEQHVLTSIPPQAESIDDVKLQYPQDNSTYLEASPIELQTINELKELKANIKQLEDRETKLKTDLIILLGANAGIKQDDKLICTYRTAKNGSRRFNLIGE